MKRARRVPLWPMVGLALCVRSVSPATAWAPDSSTVLHAEKARLLGLERWPILEDGPPLRAGMGGAPIVALRKALSARGYDTEVPARSAWFDNGLAAALRRFQRDRGLKPDGVVGGATRRALGEQPWDLVKKIDHALTHAEPSSRSSVIVVNIPAARVTFYRNGEIVFESRAVVGRPDRPTPRFSATAHSMLLNPPWTAPRVVTLRDIIPAMKTDAGYARANGLDVLEYRHGGLRRVDPGTVDWSREPRHYLFKQAPGPATPLGRIKIEMPNEHGIYLHDTPDTELFDEQPRTFSSGCIRVENIELLMRLVLGEDRWHDEAVETKLSAGETRPVAFGKPVPVIAEYRLAAVTGQGRVVYYPDYYSVLQGSPSIRLARALASPWGGWTGLGVLLCGFGLLLRTRSVRRSNGSRVPNFGSFRQ